MLRKIFKIVPLLFVVVCCKGNQTQESKYWVTETIENWRADTNHMKVMSAELSGILGLRVECVDPVTHIYDREGRRFHYNQYFGDILEIPNDWVPSLSIYGLAFNYHGAPICSPDSTCWLIPDSGVTLFTDEEFYELMKSSYEKDSLVFYKREPRYQTLSDGQRIRVNWTEGISRDSCFMRKDYQTIKFELENQSSSYSLKLRFRPDTPESEKKRLKKFYDEFPLRLLDNQ